MKDLGPLAVLTNLEHLDCEGMDYVTDLSPLTALTNLRFLNCYEMDKVTGIGPLGGADESRILGLRDDGERDGHQASVGISNVV